MDAATALYCAAVNSFPCGASVTIPPDSTLVRQADGALIFR